MQDALQAARMPLGQGGWLLPGEHPRVQRESHRVLMAQPQESHWIMFAISFLLCKSALLNMGGDCSRVGISGGENHWGPSQSCGRRPHPPKHIPENWYYYMKKGFTVKTVGKGYVKLG